MQIGLKFTGPGSLARAGAAAAGRVAEDVVVAPDVLALVTDDKPEARNMMRATMARSMSGGGAYFGHRAARAGFAEEVGRMIELWRARRRDEAVAAVTDAMVDAFCLYGAREEILEGIERRAAAGWDVTFIRLPAQARPAQMARTIEALAPS